MSGQKNSVSRPNIFLVIVIALWAGMLIYSVIEVSDMYVGQDITVMSVVGTALLILAALPLSTVIHYTNKNDRFKNVTRGLLWFVVLIIASDVMMYLVPFTIGDPDAKTLGYLMYIVACFAIMIPAGLIGTSYKKGSNRRIEIAIAIAGVLVIALAWYFALTAMSRSHVNGLLIGWAAAYIAIEILVSIVLIGRVLNNPPQDIKNLFLMLIVYFAIELAGDVTNMYAVMNLQIAVDTNYNSSISMACFSMADVFLTAALLLYTWKSINPFAVKAVNDKLIDTSRMVNELIAQSPDAICIFSPEGYAVTANEPFYRAQGTSQEQAIGKLNLFDYMKTMGIPEEDTARLKNGGTLVINDLYYPPKGLHLGAKIYPNHSADGATSGYVYTFEDITGRVRSQEMLQASLEEKEVLLKEIHHRVKNNLQIISSLLSLQSSYISDPVALGYFKDSQNRVKSMALIHERLYQSESLSRVDFTEYIDRLARSLFLSYNVTPGKVRMNLETEPMYINIDRAISCGLIINELLTNSLKYAFPGDRNGKITVSMSTAGGKCIVTVSDDGIGFPESIDFRHTITLGMQLIVMLTSQLEGTIELDRTSGTSFTLTFPV